MRTRRFRIAGVIAALFCASAGHAENVNVSRIATSLRYLNWTDEANAPIAPSGATLTYFEWARARTHGETADYFSAGSWNFNWTSAPAYPTISRSLATPPAYQQNGNNYSYAEPWYSRGNVDMYGADKSVGSQTFQTGWARSAVNYSVRVDHFSSTPLEYFVVVNHPKYMRGIQVAYTLQPGGPGGGGGTYLYKSPDAARSHSAVDVLVDGLPVWSSEKTYLYPEAYASGGNDKRETTWGNAVTANGQTKLYLGRLSAGNSMTVTFIVRTDAHATAPDCGTSYTSNYDSTYNYMWRCFDLTETVRLTSAATGPPGFSIYAKQFTTYVSIVGPVSPGLLN
jgi:hypothetical protein